MVARSPRPSSATFTVALGFIASSACGQSSRTPEPDGSAGAIATAGSAGEAGSQRSPNAIELDGPACLTRREADCTGIANQYNSNDAFDGAPELASCSDLVPFDGCNQLIYSFDAQGCAISVEPGPAGWPAPESPYPLRDCMTSAVTTARFPCLASHQLEFDESCFVP